MMNEKIMRCILIALLCIMVIFSTGCLITVRHYKQRLGQLTERLESARARNDDLTDTVDGFVERTSRIYDRAGTSITEIREAVAALQIEFEHLTAELHNISGDEHFLLDCEY